MTVQLMGFRDGNHDGSTDGVSACCNDGIPDGATTATMTTTVQMMGFPIDGNPDGSTDGVSDRRQP